MDCEKFDEHVIDALYDELDELTLAALKRHAEGCARCGGVYAGLRATREVGVLPVEEPPEELEARILDAVEIAQRTTPWHKKLLRGLAWAGSHAMRPQLAMAALFFLVIGSSLLLLRARPGTLSPVHVVENGAPTPEVIAAPSLPSASPVATVPPVAAAPAEARAKADGVVEVERPDATGAEARAALASALAVRDASGCAAAVSKLDDVAARFPGTQVAADAMWNEAACYKQMGDTHHAQQLYLALRSTGYRDRAQRELAAADNNMTQNRAAQAPAAAANAQNAGPTPASKAGHAAAPKSHARPAPTHEGR